VGEGKGKGVGERRGMVWVKFEKGRGGGGERRGREERGRKSGG